MYLIGYEQEGGKIWKWLRIQGRRMFKTISIFKLIFRGLAMPAMIEACESLNIDERVTSMSIPLCCTCCRTGAVFVYFSNTM